MFEHCPFARPLDCLAIADGKLLHTDACTVIGAIMASFNKIGKNVTEQTAEQGTKLEISRHFHFSKIFINGSEMIPQDVSEIVGESIDGCIRFYVRVTLLTAKGYDCKYYRIFLVRLISVDELISWGSGPDLGSNISSAILGTADLDKVNLIGSIMKRSQTYQSYVLVIVPRSASVAPNQCPIDLVGCILPRSDVDADVSGDRVRVLAVGVRSTSQAGGTDGDPLVDSLILAPINSNLYLLTSQTAYVPKIGQKHNIDPESITNLNQRLDFFFEPKPIQQP